MQGSRFRMLLLVLTLAVFSQASQSAPYQITVLATNISDYGGLGEWSFAALFKGEQHAVLFDTGFKEDTVLHNVLHLGVDLAREPNVRRLQATAAIRRPHHHTAHGTVARRQQLGSAQGRHTGRPRRRAEGLRHGSGMAAAWWRHGGPERRV